MAYHRSRPAISRHVLVSKFGSFHAACRAAGLQGETLRRRYTDEQLVSAFEDVCRDRIRRGLPGPPTKADFEILARTKVDVPRSVTFVGRFGSYAAFLRLYELYHRGLIDRTQLLKRARDGSRRRRGKLPPAVYAETLKRFDHRCQACGRRACDLDPGERLAIDHILPLAMGGTDDPENLTVKCTRDNRGKGARFIG